jgi:hypothetical protein
MKLYIVWSVSYNQDEVEYADDENIIGVFSDELIAYQVGCVKQVEAYKDGYYSKSEQLREWLEDNTFPATTDDLDTWKAYFNLISDDDTIEFVHDVSRLKDTDFERIHVTAKTLDEYNISTKINNL